MITNYQVPQTQSAPTPSTVPNHPQAMLAGTTTKPSSSWFPDSGAPHHVTSNVQNIQQCAPFEGSDQIIIGNGQGLPIQSIGSSSFSSPFNPNVTLTLHKLLHVPTTSKNLECQSIRYYETLAVPSVNK
ncbi:Retrovirus-related Pol polyprotein from transposon RE1 [Glycine max]|nr:Retrovirus-related Pol polyprotein from transposon RE1 [Glycine max]